MYTLVKDMSKRKPNWTDKEKTILTEEFEKRKEIIRAKFSSKITLATKSQAWEEIAEAINSQNPTVKRELKDIQKKWDNICSQAKTEFATRKKLQKQTGGGPSPSAVSDLSQKVCSIIGEDSPTLGGINGGVDVMDEEDFTMEEEEPPVSIASTSSRKPRKIISNSSLHQQDEITHLHRDLLILEKEKIKLEIEKLHLEKDKLKQGTEKIVKEKNKLALEISKLTIEMNNYGVDVTVVE